jgi:hypothetical protein
MKNKNIADKQFKVFFLIITIYYNLYFTSYAILQNYYFSFTRIILILDFQLKK